MSAITDLFNEMARLNVLNGTIRFNVVHTDITNLESITYPAVARDKYNQLLGTSTYVEVNLTLKLSNQTVEDLDFSTIADFVDRIEFSNCTFINCNFTNVVFYNCNISNCSFSNCNFTECNLDGCEGGTCDIDNNTFDNCRLDYDMYNLLISFTYPMRRQFTRFTTENCPRENGLTYSGDKIYTVYA